MLQSAHGDGRIPNAGLLSAGALELRPQAHRLLAGAQAALDADLEAARDMLAQLARVLSAAPALETPRETASKVDAQGRPIAEPARGGLAPWQLRMINEHIAANLARTIHLQTLARIAQLSTSHFCRAFKASVGETAHTFIMRKRLDHAQSLMLNTSESLSHIADACGLADQAHLSRLFRRYTGDTPNRWRRTWRKAA